MLTGGVTVNQRTASIIRLAGLLLPILLLFYGVLIHLGAADQSNYTGKDSFLIITCSWLVLAVVQYLMPSRTKLDAALKLTGYHIFAGLYILFVAGFSAPFIAAWVLLMMTTYVYFSAKGLSVSIGFLLLLAAVNSLIHLNDGSILAITVMAVIAILALGLTATSISHSQEIDGAELSRSKAEESLQRDRILTIVNNLADAVLSTDKDGVVRVYNASSLNLLDTNASLNGHHINEILTLYDLENQPVDMFSELKKSRSTIVRDDLSLTIEDESIRLEVTFSPIRSSFSRSKKTDSQDGYIVILRDVTKAKSLEEERDEFISVVSHELRTPITVAEGTISNVQLMMRRGDVAPKILTDNITTAHEQIIFLSKMVNDLSTLSRAERGVADTPELIDVRELVNDLYNEYAPQAKKKDLHFNLDLATNLGTVSASRL